MLRGFSLVPPQVVERVETFSTKVPLLRETILLGTRRQAF